MFTTFGEHLLWFYIPVRFTVLSCDRTTGELLQEYKGHTNKVRTVPSYIALLIEDVRTV